VLEGLIAVCGVARGGCFIFLASYTGEGWDVDPGARRASANGLSWGWRIGF
jgi:hypothetical protein